MNRETVQRIIELRKKGLTQAKIGAQVGLTQPEVSHVLIENGMRSITFKKTKGFTRRSPAVKVTTTTTDASEFSVIGKVVTATEFTKTEKMKIIAALLK